MKDKPPLCEPTGQEQHLASVGLPEDAEPGTQLADG